MDGQSYLLLIRDEGGPPELQVGDLSSLLSLPSHPVGRWCWPSPARGCPRWLPRARLSSCPSAL